jgi:ribosomal protein L16/L10AE
MRGAFGKPTHRAALVSKGQTLFEIQSYRQHDQIVRKALDRAAKKLSGTWTVKVEEKSDG